MVVPKSAVAPSASATPPSSANIAIEGLAHVGARAALSFAFAFLRRAWRLGEDSELCEQVICITSSFLYISYYRLNTLRNHSPHDLPSLLLVVTSFC